MIEYTDFLKIKIYSGTVVSAKHLPNAKKPAYILQVDFGPKIGIKKSTSQITEIYKKEDLVGKQVFGVINLKPKQVGKVISQCLILGMYTGANNSKVVLAKPERKIQNGLRLW
ncbi:MAG: tRNA-binding protein [Candidatus Moranbacteria bacterium]|nr:tRNA-binding protein [Candidatus Moranbacteria bacterium]